MNRLSLTSRLSLLFAVAVLSVLLVTGIAFKQLSLMHFRALDRQELENKLQGAARLLSDVTSRRQFEHRAAEFDVLFGDHERLLVTIRGPDDALWLNFGDTGGFPMPAAADETDRLSDWEWQGHLYHGLSQQLPLAGDSGHLVIELWLDGTPHQQYLTTAQRWFWIAFGLCALGSWGLGWLVARHGLGPVRAVTELMASISSRSLKERLDLGDVPQELQGLASTFNSMLARLEDDFLRLSNFSSDLAHELRTPISSLITHTEVVLARSRDAGEYREALYSNLEELQRMTKLVEEMLFIAKSDNALIEPESVAIDLHALVLQLFDYYELLADDKNVSLACSGQGRIHGDPSMLRRALSNLLSNAIRHSYPGKAVRVDIGASDGGVKVTVSNVGDSIPEDQIERIFDRFYRLDPARRGGLSPHAGLGLAISRAIVEMHGGTLACESDAVSTRFIMRLPQ
ncbi:two-component sensor histidine kinase [Marinobacterium nitratireducens]|uniref:Sensor protein n=1 Tax=Marinobacterium nitratireducens TaxID=518897 RepID=A0A917Z7I2_9GAMM|nr:heavy metal sensor histidine kinase [Marinobacterium nitratireducens]GGO76597.1 two-component sensor histidine kinase [Marinobacterium nitratireducens]